MLSALDALGESLELVCFLLEAFRRNRTMCARNSEQAQQAHLETDVIGNFTLCLRHCMYLIGQQQKNCRPSLPTQAVRAEHSACVQLTVESAGDARKEPVGWESGNNFGGSNADGNQWFARREEQP